MNNAEKRRWIAGHILPHEAEVRGWLCRNAVSLCTADIDDVLQETYARLWRADLSGIRNGRSYLFSAVRNLLKEGARRALIVPMERIGELDALRIASEEPGPERCVGARQQLELLKRQVLQLPEKARRVFEMRYFEGLRDCEIAERLGISLKVVEKQRARALARIVTMWASAYQNPLTEPDPGMLRYGTEQAEDR